MLVSNECRSSWYNRAVDFYYHLEIVEKKCYKVMDWHAQPNRTTPFQSVWSMALIRCYNSWAWVIYLFSSSLYIVLRETKQKHFHLAVRQPVSLNSAARDVQSERTLCLHTRYRVPTPLSIWWPCKTHNTLQDTQFQGWHFDLSPPSLDGIQLMAHLTSTCAILQATPFNPLKANAITRFTMYPIKHFCKN